MRTTVDFARALSQEVALTEPRARRRLDLPLIARGATPTVVVDPDELRGILESEDVHR